MKINLKTERDIAVKILSNNFNTSTAFVCIGTNKLIADSLGPMVGNSLHKSIKRYGTMSAPAMGTNVKDINEYAERNHGRENIIAVDACIQNTSDKGDMFLITNKGIYPGYALRSDSSLEVGHMSIIGMIGDNKDIVNGKYEFIGGMADYIADLINEAYCLYLSSKEKIEDAKNKKEIYDRIQKRKEFKASLQAN